MLPKALIAGATGLVGNELVSVLIKNEYYDSVHVLTRRPYNFEHLKVINHIIDFERIDAFDPGAKIRDVYICLGTTMKKAGSRENFRKVDFGYIQAIARWAKEHGVKSLGIISSVGAAPDSRNFYLRTKGETEQELIKLDFDHLIILRPSLLMGKRQEFRLTEKISIGGMKAIQWMLIGRLRKYRAVEARLVARILFEKTVQAAKKLIIVERNEMHW